MVKLLLCILCAVLITGSLLHLKHQRMEINYKINQSHKRLQNLQIELWNQQLQVAIYTAPNAIEQTVGSHHLDLVPATALPLGGQGAAPSAEADAE
jgi:hypothetical protein